MLHHFLPAIQIFIGCQIGFLLFLLFLVNRESHRWLFGINLLGCSVIVSFIGLLILLHYLVLQDNLLFLQLHNISEELIRLQQALKQLPYYGTTIDITPSFTKTVTYMVSNAMWGCARTAAAYVGYYVASGIYNIFMFDNIIVNPAANFDLKVSLVMSGVTFVLWKFFL